MILGSTTNKNPKVMSLIFTISIFVLLTFLTFFVYSNNLKSLTNSEKPIEKSFVIEKGNNSKLIADKLKEENLIKNSLAFRIYTKLNKYDDKLIAGSYNLNSNMSIEEIVENFVKGNVQLNTIKFTIPEGYELKEIAT